MRGRKTFMGISWPVSKKYASFSSKLNRWKHISKLYGRSDRPDRIAIKMLQINKANRKKKKYSRKVPQKIEELVLSASKLKFCPDQLQNLNYLFQTQLEEEIFSSETESNILLARSVTERLIQMLVSGVGTLDPNFSSKYLISLHEPNETTTSLQYLLRLDTLSSPTLYENEAFPKFSIVENDQDCPKGYARIRMFSNLYKLWGDYANAQGYLRRDKMQARYVEILARVASGESLSSPTNLDESTLCASPGKIMDACTLHRVLKVPTEEHVYYGPIGNNPRFPDSRDFRLAIVDEPHGIKVKVEFLSPTLSNILMDVTLLIGVETDHWPVSTNFPTRIPLGHSDSLLYYSAAQSGAYLVGYGVHSSAWQIRFPSAEDILLKNYSPNSTVRNILKITSIILEEMYESSPRHLKYPNSYKILKPYILKTILFHNLERDFNNPTSVILNWSPQMLSTHILRIFDQLISHLRQQKSSNYFFQESNLIANPGHLCEDDYIYESQLVQSQLAKLFDTSLMSIAGDESFEKMLIAQDMEVLLLCKWKELIDGLLPPASTRGRRFCFAGTASRKEVAYTQYTARQLEYIALLFKNVVNAREAIIRNNDETWGDHQPIIAVDENTSTDKIVYILLTIVNQAKDHYVRTNNNKNIINKLASTFDPTVKKLEELVRKSGETILDDVDLVKIVLKWLYRALDQNKRLLAPILRPYLTILFISSHGNSWFLESINRRNKRDELEALGAFCRLVNDDKVNPGDALVSCVAKKWIWAKDMYELIKKQPVRLIFLKRRNQISRHVLSIPSEIGEAGENVTGCKEEIKFATLSRRSYISTILGNKNAFNDKVPWHCIFRDESPMKKVLENTYRFGDHRCGGDIVQTLLSMQKLNILNDVSMVLPEEDCVLLQELIQKVSKDKKKNTIKRNGNWKKSLSSEYFLDGYQKYTPKDDKGGILLNKPRKLSLEKKDEIGVNKLDIDGSALMDDVGTTCIRDFNTVSYKNGLKK